MVPAPSGQPKTEAQGFQLHAPVASRRNHVFPEDYKAFIVQQVAVLGMRATCKTYGLLRKSVDRWCKNGPMRRKGAGRKTADPNLETQMIRWVEDYITCERRMPKRKYIMVKGHSFATDRFKASKGWCDKFLRRHKGHFEEVLEQSLASRGKTKSINKQTV